MKRPINTIVLCTFCKNPISDDAFANARVSDHYVYYRDGELKHIELAHYGCAQYFGGPDWCHTPHDRTKPPADEMGPGTRTEGRTE